MLNCEQLTALIGPNGSGKSTFLKALDIFYSINSVIIEEDYYNMDTSKDIIISIQYKNLNPDELKLFEKYTFENKLNVQKVITWQSSKSIQKYHGASLQNPAFDAFRSSRGASSLRTEYNKLKEIYGLPNYSTKDECEEILQGWEEGNKEQCKRRRDDGQFFGFNEVGKSHLERFTKFILVPAVRDAAEESEDRKGTPLTIIMDLVVRSVLAQRKDFAQLEETTQKQYESLLDSKNLTELVTLEESLNAILKNFVPDAGVKLNWNFNKTVEVPKPVADIRLIEDEYPSSIERVGHGLQRAFIFTLFQQLAIVRSPNEDEESQAIETPSLSPLKLPNLIIGIEEPELYQHPSRQRHFANILLKLATESIKGVVDNTQIIYTTHSPLFVDMRRLEQIRSIRKIKTVSDMPKQTKITSTNLSEIAEIIDTAEAKPKGTTTSKNLEHSLKAIMTPIMNEGFFSNIVVLVEGENDKAAIAGIAAARGINFDTEGIPIIPCLSKYNIDKPLIIFKKMGILVYPIWDSDFHPPPNQSNPAENHKLLRLCEQPVEDWPDRITEQFACFKQNLPHTLAQEIGEEFCSRVKAECARSFCLRSGENPTVYEDLIKRAEGEGKSSKSVETIIDHILALKK